MKLLSIFKGIYKIHTSIICHNSKLENQYGTMKKVNKLWCLSSGIQESNKNK